MSKFYVFIDTPTTQVQTPEEFNAEPQRIRGFLSGEKISSKVNNTAIRQANLIAVALMEALGISDDFSVMSSVDDLTNAIIAKLDDMHLTEAEQEKVRKLVIDGDGDKFLANDGEYKDIVTETVTHTDGLSFTITSRDAKTCSVRNGAANSEDIVIPPFVFIDGVQYTVTSISSAAFRLKSNIKTIIIPETITKIGDQAFDGCSSLKTITIPKSVVTLGSSTFYGCSSLEEIEIPDSVKTITKLSGYERSLFHDCTNLKKVSLGKGVRILPYQCFYNCPNLIDVIVKGNIHTVMSQLFSVSSTATVWTDENQVATLENLFKEWDGSKKYPNVTITTYRDLLGVNEVLNDDTDGSVINRLFYHEFKFVTYMSSNIGNVNNVLHATCTCLMLSRSETKIDNVTEFRKYANQGVIWLFNHTENKMLFGRFMSVFGGDLIVFDSFSSNSQESYLEIVGVYTADPRINTFSMEFLYDNVIQLK